MRSYLRIIAYGRAYYGQALLSFLATLVFSIFSAVSLFSLIPFLEILLGNTDIPVPQEPLSWLNTSSIKAHGYYQLSQLILAYDKLTVLLWFCGFLLVAIMIKNIARYFSGYWMLPLEHGIVNNLREVIFDKISRLDLPFFTRKKKGDIIGVLISDVQVVQDGVLGTVIVVIREPALMVTFLAGLLFISWKLTLFTLIVLPLTGLLIDRIRKPLQRRTKEGQTILGKLVTILDEFISGVRIVKGFQREDFERDRFQTTSDEYFRMQIGIGRRVELASPITEVISIVVVCAIIFYGGSMIFAGNGSLTGPEFITFIGLFTQFLMPIRVLAAAITRIQKANGAYDKIQELMEEEPEVVDAPNPKPFSGLEREIRFEKVWFGYDDADVLKDVSFQLPKGQMLALVGPSGAGKSTLVDLIPRFYDPRKGKITFDGIDVRQISLSDLRRQIGIVAQEGILFHDTILRNIAYGIENPDREAVIEAARVANAHEFISELPKGYDTMIGERGTMLSGGQRQRISIARAVLSNPPILILDEATSNLDTQSEKLVQEALEKLMTNRTSIVIAHRLSTVQHAHQILTIDQGRIVERGTHQELLDQGGLYQKLHDLQFAL